MNYLDIIIIVVLLAGFILGYKDGFVRKIIGFVGFVLALYLSIKLSAGFGKFVEEMTGIELYLSQIIGAFLLFLIVMLTTAVVKRIVHPFDKVNNLVNQLIGGVLGMLQLLIFLSAVFFLLSVFNSPAKETRKSSMLYGKVYSVIPKTIIYIKGYSPDTESYIKDYINDKDTLK